MQAQGVALRLVQVQAEVIEPHHLLEPAGQLVEQRGQIAVRDDRLRNGQQGPVALVGGRRLSVQVSGCHGEAPGQSLIRNQQVVRRTPGVRSRLREGHLTIFGSASVA